MEKFQNVSFTHNFRNNLKFFFLSGFWSSFPSLSNSQNDKQNDKITELESEVTNLKDLVNQHRNTVNSKFVSNF